MKKTISYMMAMFTMLLFTNCGNGSSGSQMIDLDIRMTISDYALQETEKSTSTNDINRHQLEEFQNLFTVLPGPYEFVWEELKNTDGAIGYEQCSTKLKIRLRLNKTLKAGNKMDDDKILEGVKDMYRFSAFDAEGNTVSDLLDKNDDENALLLLDCNIKNLWGTDGKIGYVENTDGLWDFYHFLTSEPGTEFDLIIDCGIHLCKDIKKIIEHTKGIYIETTRMVYPGFYDWRFE